MPLFTIPYLQIDVAAHCLKTERSSQNDNMRIVMRLYSNQIIFISYRDDLAQSDKM